MPRIPPRIVKRHRGDRGATAVEYALMISGVALVLVIATFALGDSLAARLGDLAALIH